MTTNNIQIRTKGKAVSVPSAELDGKIAFALGRWLKTATVPEEDLIEGGTVSTPDAFVSRLMETDSVPIS